jgi:hypothetical protein
MQQPARAALAQERYGPGSHVAPLIERHNALGYDIYSTMQDHTRVRDHAEIANPTSVTMKPISVAPVNTTTSPPKPTAQPVYCTCMPLVINKPYPSCPTRRRPGRLSH